MNPVQWLALGFALSNPAILARMLAELEPGDFDYGKPRQFFAAVQEGKDAVRLQLSGLGVVVEGDQKAFEAVLDAVRESGRHERQRAAADAIFRASRCLGPEEFTAFAAEQLAATGPKESRAVAGKVAKEIA